MPLVVFVLLLIIQAGAYYHARQVAKVAVDRAVAVARTEHGTAGFGQAQAEHVLTVVGDGSLSDARVRVTRASGEVTVALHADAPHFVPFWPGTVDVVSSGPVEAFDEGGRRG
ncbi:hypothetical protein KGQ19_01270 [Catenulispora sp. NL8]|uniref:TadE family protein n=2 Tax=Catenulispora pinistramenti TaxID=2705254 RepID=A0ABS5KHN3_9ACTN|nr:hypothetical protein [Catenulispora pinistramenti]